MTLALPKTGRRMVAIGLLLLFVWFCWFAAIAPLRNLSSSRIEHIDVLSEQLAHLRHSIALRPELERTASNRKAQLAALTSLWTGPSVAAVGASVQGALRQIVVAEGGQVRSASEVAEPAERGFDRVGVRLDIEGSLDTLRKTLEGIEASSPALFVESLLVRSPGTVIDPQRAPTIGIELTAVAYVQLAGSRPSNLATEARP